MTHRWIVLSAVLALAGILLATAAGAQDPGDGPGSGAAQPFVEDEQLHEAMRHYFQNRLRDELALTDEQMAEIAPKMERIEQTRAESGRDRRATVRQLQRGLRQGESDERLQGLLDALGRIESEQQRSERATLSEIDALLTVRQRVKLRFFIQGFRRQIQRRVRDLQEDGWEPQAPPRRRP